MAKGHNNNNLASDLKKQIETMEARIKALETANQSLEKKVEHLESRVVISERVSEQLTTELDRLDQYHRRSNIIIKNVFLPENESDDDVKKVVTKIVKNDIVKPELLSSVDKHHRIGKVKEVNGKKMQNIIARFKSHSARYSVYQERKKVKNAKISANLTKRRSQLLNDASLAVKNLEKVDFCFSNIHGDLMTRLVEPFNGKYVFNFNSLKVLSDLLMRMNFIEGPIDMSTA